ncbi:hypothetical protein [Capsulimonas corticalis]|nr:hypothetical protein [Capsulimonas corticalis]
MKKILTALGAMALICGVGAAGRAQQPTPSVPNPNLTPGAVLPVTKDDLCVPGYTKKVRNVPQSVKNQVYAEYGVTHHKAGDYEVDHLISLELGGSNSIKNLWPESYKSKPYNAHVKDKLENRLHALVCSGQLDLAAAQHAIATDWIGAYKKYMGASPSSAAPKAHAKNHSRSHWYNLRIPQTQTPPMPMSTTPDSPSGQVWVNTKSGKYFQPGARYYGKTKQGQYMSEKDAIQQGFTAAGQ